MANLLYAIIEKASAISNADNTDVILCNAPVNPELGAKAGRTNSGFAVSFDRAAADCFVFVIHQASFSHGDF